MKKIILFLILILLPLPVSAELSTNFDGTFQAIALSPTLIAVYSKGGGTVTMNGAELKAVSADKNGYVRYDAENLDPGAFYRFRRGNETITERTSHAFTRIDTDLLVVGANSSGIAAALTAARMGIKVLLVEETNRIGGISANGLGSCDLGDARHASGVFAEFLGKIGSFYDTSYPLRYEPRVVNAVYKDMVYNEPNITLFTDAKIKPTLEGNKVTGGVINNKYTVCAKVSVDATDTGDFASLCPTVVRYGREKRSEREPHGGKIYFNNATQSVLPGSGGKKDRRLPSYAYLLTVKDYGADAPELDMPPDYDPAVYEHSPEWNETWNVTSGRLPNNEFEINQHPFGSDLPGINYKYANLGDRKRAKIDEKYKNRVLGYIYYLRNERGHTNLGLADDEYLDTDNFPQTLYVRECKRIMGERVFDEYDVTHTAENYDFPSIGIGGYPMDSHATEDLKDPTAQHRGEGEMWLKSFTPIYRIPYSVIIPSGAENLLVSTCVSSTHIGYSTLRIEFTRSSMGQAAGTLAAEAVLSRVSPRQVKPFTVQRQLLKQGQYLAWVADVPVESPYFEAVNYLSSAGVFRDENFRPEDIATEEEIRLVCKRLGIDNPGFGTVTRGELAKKVYLIRRKGL
ncbi:MAG: FAD-dependent oxidoreductase [Abditibacteriota bacterium]|nr:FAD-dependent oxidoreductase [Abditibacteriota bacterium]